MRSIRGDAMSGSSRSHTILTLFMNVLFFVAVLITGRVVIEFFGALAMTTAGGAIVSVTDIVIIPAGVAGVRTPYGGVFDVDAAITVGVVLVLEWALSVVRARG
ncbi:MAG: hypothetical protein P1P71_01170 [Anaerosomatales bacterium]|nr:hypothetical protein [Anaerosomatales bacterium]